MTDRPRASGQQERPGEEDNPFAPPPEGQPEQPWRPRHPEGGSGNGRDSGSGDGLGDDSDRRPRWGGQWGRRQPGRGGGPFGGPGGDRQGEDGGNGRRWDPEDPVQRHARYAVLAGMWGVFAGLLSWEWLGLLLGALALYWGISALRGGPRDAEGRPPAPTPDGRRPQRGSAIAGVVLASLSLLIVAASYSAQLVYKEYFDCVSDSLTAPSKAACEEHLPSQLRSIFGEQD
ncbi:hypothetical protein [Streptomyces triticirhizae]|uniref:DUF4190 domain-containing protein n=1 Tax=Streptomyces triticirhizae TaxID=2483353 RepID=A0A3M2L8T0_9ACTN|nr:hypothetical protein [Streptomyces triticirhizae]RMI33804.1 hypothetical protein EBN88_24250 [Streptomyces triticirhizae]